MLILTQIPKFDMGVKLESYILEDLIWYIKMYVLIVMLLIKHVKKIKWSFEVKTLPSKVQLRKM